MDRCEECGSWEAECSAADPVNGCGCARCANAALRKALAENNSLKAQLEVAEAFHDVAVKERDRYHAMLRDSDAETLARLAACERVVAAAAPEVLDALRAVSSEAWRYLNERPLVSATADAFAVIGRIAQHADAAIAALDATEA